MGKSNMSPIYEHSAGVVAFRRDGGRIPLYLVIHSATVRNPRARWEFPKGGIEPGETPRAAAEREFEEETGIISWSLCEGFERNLSYTYMRLGRRRFKTVTYYLGEVFDISTQARSHEHIEDPTGHWSRWGPFAETYRQLYHARVRRLLVEADAWLRGRSLGQPDRHPGGVSRRPAASRHVLPDEAAMT